MAGLPDLFACARHNMRLTATGCARMWLTTRDLQNAPKPWEGRSGCTTCPVGATHAGQALSPVAAYALAVRKICPRCRRVAERLVHGRLCISCYNRDREAKLGVPANSLTLSDRQTVSATDTEVTATLSNGKRYACTVNGGGLLAMGIINPPTCTPAQ
jgi:hypothetical protein